MSAADRVRCLPRKLRNDERIIMINWRKAKRSMNNGNCVEVASNNGVMVRDTTDRTGPMVTYSAAAWEKFIAGVKRS